MSDPIEHLEKIMSCHPLPHQTKSAILNVFRKLETQNAKFRAALERIASKHDGWFDDAAVAREALNPD